MTEILEHIPVKIFSDEGNDLPEAVAKIIAGEIEKNNKDGKHTVLGLTTGNTLLDVYRVLISLYQQKKVDFQNVITFNQEEYYDLPQDHVFSSCRFMHENFFDNINIKPENIHLLNGAIPENEVESYCKKYEADIKAVGGIDLHILGIGGDGHIGYNDPGSELDTRTRLIPLDNFIKAASVPDFGDVKYVPDKAITMGMGTILEAKKIILFATGDHKASIIRKAVEGKVCSKVLASYLQTHRNAVACLDQAAASMLTKIITPWFVEVVDWNQQINRVRAVCHLSEFLKKPITDLETRDFLQYSLKDLIQKYPLPTLTFDVMQTIGAKITNPSKLPFNKKVIVFSPHPDDDIISMGSTLMNLVKNKNEVYCIYMTPGSNAVFDHDVEKLLLARVAYDMQKGNKEELKKDTDLATKVNAFLKQKRESRYGMIDTDEVRKLKTIVRQVEGMSACSYVGVAGHEFLNPEFYQSGKAKKNPLTKGDIELVWGVLQKYKPDIVYAAGDLTDPNGTHRLCLRAIITAFDKYGDEKNKPQLWMYRGAWQEYHPADADIFLTMTEADLLMKREGIFRHQSQKDRPPQPGHSKKEFWQASEERNKGTAEALRNLGFPGMYALEGLKLYKKPT